MIDSSTSLLHQQTHDIVRFAMGSPAAEAVPSAILAGIAGGRAAVAADAYDYAATEGDPPLREALLEMLRGTSDETTADRLTITAGGMQGLDLFCKIFVDPGDLVVVESPTYTNGSATALSYGAQLLEVPVDDDGMDVEALDELVASAGRTPKAIYTIPTFQNPSGATLSLARRHRLLELARSWGSMVIDDDPYGLLRFAGRPAADAARAGRGRPAGLLGPDLLQDRRPGSPRRLGRHRAGAAAAADQRQAGDGHLHQPAGPAAARRVPHRRPSRRPPGRPSARSTGGARRRCTRRCASTSATSRAGPTPRAGSSSG